MKRITIDQFLRAFKKSWIKVGTKRKMLNENPWTVKDKATWTNYMLGDNGVFSEMHGDFKRVDKKILYKQQWYTVDGLFVGGDDLYGDDLCYPSSIYVLLEHELASDLETEMWKLIHWRAPLKVIFFYDFSEPEKKEKESNLNWLEKKLDILYGMLDAVNKFYPENDKTEYLFIIGTRKELYGQIIWKYCSGNDRELRIL